MPDQNKNLKKRPSTRDLEQSTPKPKAQQMATPKAKQMATKKAKQMATPKAKQMGTNTSKAKPLPQAKRPMSRRCRDRFMKMRQAQLNEYYDPMCWVNKLGDTFIEYLAENDHDQSYGYSSSDSRVIENFEGVCRAHEWSDWFALHPDINLY